MTLPYAHTVSDPIKQLAARISDQLETFTRQGQRAAADSLLYLGHWHDAIPRAIWMDQQLEAVDVRCWGVIRIQALAGKTVVLSLHQFLQSQLGYSKPTVSKVLFILRLTRWISLCSKIRSAAGQFKGHIYAIHDAPVSINDALYLDADYLTFVGEQCAHQHQQVKAIAQRIWQSVTEAISEQPPFLDEQGSSMAITDCLREVNGQNQVKLFNPAAQVNFFNLAEKTYQVKNMNLDESQAACGFATEKYNQVHKMNLATITTTTTSCSSNLNKKTTTTEYPDVIKHLAADETFSTLVFPPDFNASEQALALLYLQSLEPALRQPFLDETAAQIDAKRHSSKPIRNPVAFLGWLCNEHSQGNTRLTSLSIRYRENQQRKRKTDQQIQKKQQELASLAPDKLHSPANHNPARQLREALQSRKKQP